MSILVLISPRHIPYYKFLKFCRFIVTSRQLFSRATGGQNEDSFRVDIHLLFNSFNKMLSYNTGD